MANMPKLVAELRVDPLTRGYSGMTDSEVVTSLYTVNRSRNKTNVTASEILQAVDVAEYKALTDGEKKPIDIILGFGDTINPFGKEADFFVDSFGAGSNTITALAALRVETVSRAVELGLGDVTVGDVIAARTQL
jgi:hypothetical protein